MRWVPGDVDVGRRPKLRKVRARVCDSKDDLVAMHHRDAMVWVAKHGEKFYVLQCDVKVDVHRVVGVADSAFVAYALRSDVETMLKLQLDNPDHQRVCERAMRLEMGLRVPRRKS